MKHGCKNYKCTHQHYGECLAHITKHCDRFISPDENPALSASSPTSGSVFNYVNVSGRECEGWLNIFFGDEIIALVNNVDLANEIRKTISERKQNK